MMDHRQIMRAYEEGINNPALRHILLNYSETETGLRNREGPVGSVNRDQGIFDAYAGRQRLMLGTAGAAVLLGRWAALVGDEVSLKARDVTTLMFLGKHFHPALFGGQRVAAVRPGAALAGYIVEKVDGTKVPLGTLLEEKQILQDPVTYGLTPTEGDLFNLADKAIGRPI